MPLIFFQFKKTAEWACRRLLRFPRQFSKIVEPFSQLQAWTMELTCLRRSDAGKVLPFDNGMKSADAEWLESGKAPPG